MAELFKCDFLATSGAHPDVIYFLEHAISAGIWVRVTVTVTVGVRVRSGICGLCQHEILSTLDSFEHSGSFLSDPACL